VGHFYDSFVVLFVIMEPLSSFTYHLWKRVTDILHNHSNHIHNKTMWHTLILITINRHEKKESNTDLKLHGRAQNSGKSSFLDEQLKSVFA